MARRTKARDSAEPLRVAVMGAGRWGVNVVRTLSAVSGARLAWVADPDPAARERSAEVCPDARTCESIDEALGDVEAVAVCTPAADHFAHGSALLAAGKHVLVEKPVATASDEARRLARAADRDGLTLMVGHQLLFHPLFSALVEIVADGGIGPLRAVRAERTGVVDFEREPDVLWAYGPHDVALILALAGEPPEAVRGRGMHEPRTGVICAAEIDIGFGSGLEAGILLDGVAAERRCRLTAVGEAGEVVFDDSEPGGRLTLCAPGGDRAEQELFGPDRERGLEPLARSCRHFVESVRQRARPRPDGRHGIEVTRVIERAAGEMRSGEWKAKPEAGTRRNGRHLG